MEKTAIGKYFEARDFYESRRKAYRKAKDSGEFYKAELDGLLEEIDFAKAEMEAAKKEADKALGL